MALETEIKTVETILDKGVRVPIPAPFFLRLFTLRNIRVTIRRPVLGNMLRIARMYMQMNLGDDLGNNFTDWSNLLIDQAKPVSRIVAIGILRGRLSGWLLCRPLACYLRWHIDSRQLASLAGMLVTLGGVQDFLNTIRFLATMKTTQPRNLSQE